MNSILISLIALFVVLLLLLTFHPRLKLFTRVGWHFFPGTLQRFGWWAALDQMSPLVNFLRWRVWEWLRERRSGVVAALLSAALFQGAATTMGQTSTNSPTFPTLWGALDQGVTAIEHATPWDVGIGYGHSISGTGKNIVFGDIAYDFLTNADNTGFSSGAVVGVDDLFTRHQSSYNSVGGGMQVQETGHPLGFIGATFLTNIVSTVTIADLVATPKAGSDIGNLVVASDSFDLVDFSRFSLLANVHYENRSGQGFWDGNYIMGSLFIQRNF